MTPKTKGARRIATMLHLCYITYTAHYNFRGFFAFSHRQPQFSAHFILFKKKILLITPHTVLITGRSDGGITSALGKLFQQQGYHVFATARNSEKMTRLQGRPNVTSITLDITNQTNIRTAVKTATEATSGRLPSHQQCQEKPLRAHSR